MPNRNEWEQQSKTLLDQAKNAGFILKLNDARINPSQKFSETMAGKARQQKVGGNADGNEKTYSNPKDRGTGMTDGEIMRKDGDGRPRRRARAERERERFRNMKCYNCTNRGHSAALCTKKKVKK